MKSIDVLGGAINEAAIDRFTLAHYSVGLAYGLLGLHPALALTLAIGWEVVETSLKRRYGGTRFFPHTSPDSMVNATVDAVAVMGGYATVRVVMGK